MKVDKKMVLKALTDPKFRKMLIENPEMSGIKGGRKEADLILNLVGQIDAQAGRVGDGLLCVIVDRLD